MRSFLRRRALVAVAAAIALAAAGIAMADQGPGTTTLVSATFYANTIGKTQSQACAGANNNAYTVTDASYTGAASSADSRLTGPLTISVQSVYDSTTNVGSLTGELEIDGTSASQPSRFRAALTAVDVNGTVQGYLIGDAGRRAVHRELQLDLLGDRRLQLVELAGNDRIGQRNEHGDYHERLLHAHNNLAPSGAAALPRPVQAW